MALIVSLMTDLTVLLAFAALVALLCRFQSAALFAVLAVFFVDSIFIVTPGIEVGGFNLYPQDALGAILLSAAVVRLAFRRPSTLHLLWGVFGIAAVISLYAGYQAYGAKASFNEFRQFFCFIATLSYFSSIDYSEKAVRSLKKAWSITAGALLVLAVYRWAAEWLGLPGLDTWSILRISSVGRITRTLNAAQTLFLFQTWLLMAPSVVRARSRFTQFASVILLAFVFVLQHRTVWVAGLVCLVYLFGRARTLSHRPLWLLAGAGLICAGGLLMMLTDASNPISSSLRFSVNEVTDQRSTLEWRITSWRQLVAEEGRPITLRDTFLGYRPFGAGMRRRVNGSVVTVSAHNYYVESLMRMGFIGLFALLLCLGAVVSKIWRNRSSLEADRQWRTILLSIFVGEIVYCFSYGLTYEQGILLGAAMSFALAKAPSRQLITRLQRVRVSTQRRPFGAWRPAELAGR